MIDPVMICSNQAENGEGCERRGPNLEAALHIGQRLVFPDSTTSGLDAFRHCFMQVMQKTWLQPAEVDRSATERRAVRTGRTEDAIGRWAVKAHRTQIVRFLHQPGFRMSVVSEPTLVPALAEASCKEQTRFGQVERSVSRVFAVQ